MRSIPLRDNKQFKSVDVIRDVLAKAPSGINIDEIRRRVPSMKLLVSFTVGSL